MAHLHIEIPDELHKAIRMEALERGESVKAAGERLFGWYVEQLDFDLVRGLEIALDWLDEVCNADNPDMATPEGVGVAKMLQSTLAAAARGEEE